MIQFNIRKKYIMVLPEHPETVIIPKAKLCEYCKSKIELKGV